MLLHGRRKLGKASSKSSKAEPSVWYSSKTSKTNVPKSKTTKSKTTKQKSKATKKGTTKATKATKKRKKTSSPSTAPTVEDQSTTTNTKDKNVCLTNPPDVYRTCMQRAVDPNNDLTVDTILRDQYNIGATKFINGESTEGYITPHTPPYTTDDESLTFGTVYLSMIRNNHTELTCDDQLNLEETVLQWLNVSLVLRLTIS